MSQYLSVYSLSHILLFELIYYTILQRSQAIRIVGTWSSRSSRFSILAKFGFQQIDPLDAEHSRGFVYGNVSSKIVNGAQGVLLIIPRSLVNEFINKAAPKQSCDTLLK
ncbi:hypothetical protein WUBG_00546, partial [Wuchereria bancrofti]